jgi:hypothetical protein
LFVENNDLCKGFSADICWIENIKDIETKDILLSVLHYIYLLTNSSFYFYGTKKAHLDDKFEMYLDMLSSELNELDDEEDKLSTEKAILTYNNNGKAIEIANLILKEPKYTLENLLDYAEAKQGTIIADLICQANELIIHKFDISNYSFFNENTEISEYPCPIYEYMQIVYKISDDCKMWWWLDQDFQNNANEFGVASPIISVIYNGKNMIKNNDFYPLKIYTEFLNSLTTISTLCL